MTDATDWDDDILGEDTNEDGLIDLTDIVEEDSETPENEGVIELTELVEDEQDEPAPIELEMDSDDDLEESFLSGEEISSDDEITMPDMEEESLLPEDDDQAMESEDLFEEGDSLNEPEIPVAAAPLVQADEAVSTDVSMADLEAALERVIEKKFSDKIETILFEVMERVIEKEIAQIKESLQKDLDQIASS